MDRVLSFCGILFGVIGALFTAVGVGIVYAARMPAFLLFCVLGLLFFCLGVGMLLWRARRQKQQAALLENGQRIWADIVEVGPDLRVQFNGRCPFIILCEAKNPADGEVYTFTSEGLWFDPSSCLEGRRQLPVYVDPDNWKHHAVDLDGILPQQG